MTKLSCRGVARDDVSESAVVVYFSRPLTDDELRFFDEVCGRSAPLMDGADHPETSAQKLAREMREGTARFVSAEKGAT